MLLRAIRTIRAYRTVSLEAAQVLAGMLPVDLLSRERRTCYLELRGVVASQALRKELKATARADSNLKWQEQWDTSEKGRWTHGLIPNIARWCDREFGDCTYQLTQILTGHGSFGAYLHRIGRAASPGCVYCDADLDDASHTLLDCPRWDEERAALAGAMGEHALTPGGIVASIIRDREGWDAMETFAAAVMSQKEADEG